MTKQYWHELTPEQRSEARDTKSYMEVVHAYQQPEWCGLYNALHYDDGCWSLLLTEESVCSDFCKTCDLCDFDVVEINWHTTLITKIHVSGWNKEQAIVYDNIHVAQKDHFFKIVIHGSYKIGDSYIDKNIEKK